MAESATVALEFAKMALSTRINKTPIHWDRF